MKTGALTTLIRATPYKEEPRRDYIGASLIGSDCLRQIWYEFRGAPSEPFSLTLLRTFEIGKRLESLVINLLVKAGVSVNDEKAALSYSDCELDYFKGNADGLVVLKNNESADASILEIKTAKSTSFNVFKSKGLKKWSPRYYAQIQAYMGMSGIWRAYIVVLNKDNSDLWDEEIDFDSDFYGLLREKAKLIYEAKSPPPRISSSPLWYQCKSCRFRAICHE